MSGQELLNQIISQPAAASIDYLTEEGKAVRELFANAPEGRETDAIFSSLILRITELFTQDEQNYTAIQVLLTHLALYFQKRKKAHFVENCRGRLAPNARYYNRLRAWLHKEWYNAYDQHFTELSYYLRLLNADALKGDEDATYDLVSDLTNYVEEVEQMLPAQKFLQFKAAIITEANQDEFIVVKAYSDSLEREVPGLIVEAYTDKEYVPSIQMQQVFEDGFMNEIRRRSPDFPQKPLGYDSTEVRFNIIRCGQADFDADYRNLSSLDVVKLYCYFNMRKHFFTSLSVFERTDIVEQQCGNPRAPLKFIDIGCGPGTAGLALLDCIRLKGSPSFPIHYYGIDTSTTMQQMADVLLQNPLWHDEGKRSFHASLSDINVEEIGGNGCILISASYVFASDTLDPGEIAVFISSLKSLYPRTDIVFFFQNSIKESRNTNYVQFKNLLVNYDELFQAKETILYHMKSGQFFNVKSEPVYYEVLRF